MGIRQYVRDRKEVKAMRAMEQGIAGHQAAMKALGRASGGWKRTADNSVAYSDTPSLHNSWFEPGKTRKGNE